MRNTLLATAAMLGLAFATQAAFAQAPTPDAASPAPDAAPPAADAPAATPDSGTMALAAPKKMHHHHKMANSGSGDEKFAHEPGTGESGPASAKASNIDQADSHSDIAPHLPMPKAGHDATADAYLGAAQRALKAHRTGEAQQSLEMAETRLLTRSTPADSAGQPAQDPQVMQINEARKALGHGDMAGASSAIKTALGTSGGTAMAAPAAGGGMTTTDTTSTSMTPGSMTHATNGAPTGTPGMASSGAGVQPGASAGASTGGGALGSGTQDSPAGAK